MSWHFTPPWLYKCCIQHLKCHPIHGCKETLVLSLNRTFPLGGHSPRRQMYVCWVSRFRHVWFFATSQTVAHQAPLSVGILQAKYWSGLPCPPPGDLLNPGIEPRSLMSPALVGALFTTSITWEALRYKKYNRRKLYAKKKMPPCQGGSRGTSECVLCFKAETKQLGHVV